MEDLEVEVSAEAGAFYKVSTFPSTNFESNCPVDDCRLNASFSSTVTVSNRFLLF